MILITEASEQALEGLRDFSTIKWYIIPLLAIILYIYFTELKKARKEQNYDVIYAGLTVLGMDFINETWNGMVFHISQYSAFWTTPGDTALRVMVGWNIEIIFMFAIAGIIFYNSLPEDKDLKILGIPNRWFFAILFSAFCVFVECILNIGGHLVWVYPWWNLSLTGIWLIFLIGYFHFFAAVNIILSLKSERKKKIAIGIIWGIAIILNLFFLGVFGWVY
ncbi:MAG: hypothetical protein ACOC4M_01350 [Promethearchaeia archaeon]